MSSRRRLACRLGLGRLPFVVSPIGTIGRFTVSRDGRWALTVQEDRWERDIAMVENFR